MPARADLDAVLADQDIDAVVLALPNELHFDFAQRAARAGKHVYIEKPIANSMADALAIAALERAHGVRIVVGHCARLLTGIRAIRQAIDAGKLGKLSQIEANFSNDRGLRLTREDWRWYSERAPGGSLSQIGVHQFDTLRYLGGDIAAVSASAARHSPVGAEVEDQWIVTVHFADGKLGTRDFELDQPGHLQRARDRRRCADGLRYRPDPLGQPRAAARERDVIYAGARQGPRRPASRRRAARQHVSRRVGNVCRQRAGRCKLRAVGRQWLPGAGGGLCGARIGQAAQPRGRTERDHRGRAGRQHARGADPP